MDQKANASTVSVLIAFAIAICVALVSSFMADQRKQSVRNESAILGTWTNGHTTYIFRENHEFVMQFKGQGLDESGKWRMSGNVILQRNYLPDGSLACEYEMMQLASNGVLQYTTQTGFGRTLRRSADK